MLNKLKTINMLRNEKIILIYQHGKVASTTLANSIENQGIKTIKQHSFYNNITKDIFVNYKSSKFYNKSKDSLISTIKRRIILYLLKMNSNVKIISLVREPISRNISFYFQEFQIPLMDIAKSTNHTVSKNFNIDKLIDDFYLNFNHQHGIKWFDNEFKKSFGVDVFNHEFNSKKGYSIINQNDLDIMIIKLEKIKDLKEQIKKFVGLKKFKLIKENLASKKWYSEVYKEFKSKIEINEEYIDLLYNSRYMKHFYTKKEIKDFKDDYLSN